MKLLVILLGSLVPILTTAQKSALSKKYYNQGLKAFNMGNYQQAEAMFTKAIDVEGDSYAYFNRAITRSKQNNNSGYCMDLSMIPDDEEAKSAFNRDCAVHDTSLVNEDFEKVEGPKWYGIKISKIHKYGDKRKEIVILDRKKRIICEYYERGGFRIFNNKYVDQLPHPKDSISSVAEVFKTAVSSLSASDKTYIDRFVTIKMIILKDGSILNVSVKGIPNSLKAFRSELISNIKKTIPVWEPAIRNGQQVACEITFIQPIKIN